MVCGLNGRVATAQVLPPAPNAVTTPSAPARFTQSGRSGSKRRGEFCVRVLGMEP